MPLRWTTNTAVKTSGYTAAAGDVVLCDPTGGAFAITLPTAVGNDRMIVVKNQSASTNNITVTAAGGETVDGAGTLVMSTARRAVMLISDGVSDWMTI